MASSANALVNNATYSAVCSNGKCQLSQGIVKGANAWGRFDDAIETSGWGHLFITTAGVAGQTSLESFAGGFVEGALTKLRIDQHYTNLISSYNVTEAAWKFLDMNTEWARLMVEENPKDPIWIETGRLYQQLDGLAAGYTSEGGVLTSRQLSLLQLQGDLGDVLLAVAPSTRPDFAKMTDSEIRDYEMTHLHCSAIIKVDANYSELYAGHSMWWGYYAMLPIYKRYDMKGSGRAASLMTFPSYPGILSSTDDFYTMDSNIVAIETTLPVYNMSLYDLIRPSSLLFWVRVLVANRLATTAPGWMDVFAKYNSGTYNNMWIVVDYNLFKPGMSLRPNTLWIAEQLPGYFQARDQTDVLKYGYFPSYNRCLYPETSALAGQDDMVAQKGNYYSYQLYSRAEIFRRDQGSFDSINALQKAIRYNQYKTDPLSYGDPLQSLAGRGDITVPIHPPRGAGAINGKLTSNALMKTHQSWAVAGPTHDDLPVFSWSTAPPVVSAISHVGQPDRWDFSWMLMKADL